MPRSSIPQAAADSTAAGVAAAVTSTFQCNVCRRGFSRRDHLVRHKLAHSKIRPFRCGLCGRQFGRRDALLRHSAHVHQGRPPCGYELVQADHVQGQSTSPQETRDGSNDSAPGTPDRVNEGASTALTDTLSPAVEFLGSTSQDNWLGTTEDLETTNSASTDHLDSSLSSVATFSESDFDDFIDRLAGIVSYSDVAQTLCPEPQRQSDVSWDAGFHESSDCSSLFAASEHNELAPHEPMLEHSFKTYTYALPSLHQGLFPSEQPGPSLSIISPTSSSWGSLTQLTFERLIQSYKTHSATIRPFLHFPTLDISLHTLARDFDSACDQPRNQWNRRPHRSLLLSIMALGAICDQKEALALELYHRTRKEIIDWLAKLRKQGSDESLQLDVLQAFINYVCCGTKFGDKSIEDLLIGHTASLRSLVQEMGLQKPVPEPQGRGGQPPCTFCSSDAASDWLDWVRYEERKRTFFTYFALLSSTLTYMDTVTSMDWREVKHRMPCNDEVWAAETPEEWRRAFVNEPPGSLFVTEVKALFSSPQARARQDAMRVRESQPRNDFSCFILIAALHREAWLQRVHSTLDLNAMQIALRNWQTNWLLFTPQDENRPLPPLRGCSLAMFDHSQLLLHLDTKDAKEALISREYGRFCVTLPTLGLCLDSEGSGCSLLVSRDDWQQTYDIFFHPGRRGAFRHVALYCVHALELAFRVHSDSLTKKTGPALLPHTGTAVFFCIQILASWLCFFSNSLNKGLYADWVDGPDNSEEWEDISVLGKILAFARNRRSQFNAEFDVPASPDVLDGPSAGRLASDLLDFHALIFHSCGTTLPSFKHLGAALKARSARISEWLQPDICTNIELSP